MATLFRMSRRAGRMVFGTKEKAPTISIEMIDARITVYVFIQLGYQLTVSLTVNLIGSSTDRSVP